MKMRIGILVAGLLLFGCATPSDRHYIGTYVGTVDLDEIYTFTVDNTHCIIAERYSSAAMSCDWGHK